MICDAKAHRFYQGRQRIYVLHRGRPRSRREIQPPRKRPPALVHQFQHTLLLLAQDPHSLPPPPPPPSLLLLFPPSSPFLFSPSFPPSLRSSRISAPRAPCTVRASTMRCRGPPACAGRCCCQAIARPQSTSAAKASEPSEPQMTAQHRWVSPSRRFQPLPTWVRFNVSLTHAAASPASPTPPSAPRKSRPARAQ